jgi:hypothetical protein
MNQLSSTGGKHHRRPRSPHAAIAVLCCLGFVCAAQALAGGGGVETFDGFGHTGSSYASGTFLGRDGSAWTYAKARGDFSINGASPTLQKAKDAFIRSGTIPGGIGSLTLSYQRVFSPSLDVQVYVNDMLVGTIAGGDGTVQTWTSGELNVEGDVVLMISNRVNSGTVTLDDLSWTGYVEGQTAPVFEPLELQGATAGTPMGFVVGASGEPAPVLVLQATTASAGFEFVPETGMLSYLPPSADIGLQTFTFSASNDVGVALLDVDVLVREPEALFGLETFDGFDHPGSDFVGGTFTGQDGSTWTYANASGNLSIDGKSPTLDKAKDAYLRSGTIPGGVKSLQLKYRKAGNQAVDCAVYVNDIHMGSITGGDGTVQTWNIDGLNVEGDVVLVFSNRASSGRITLDDIAWDGYSSRPVATVALGGLEQVYNGESRIVTATTVPDGLAVLVAYDGSVTPPTDAGSYGVTATVIDGIHDGAAHGTLVVAKANQSIVFPVIGDRIVTDQPGLAATASSGLPVVVSVVSGPATLVDGTLTFQGTGVVSVVATQAGDENWNAAPVEVQTFNVMSLLAVSAGHLNLRENGEGRFFVKLNRAPLVPTTVTVSRVSGDPDLAVKGAATRVFHASNWNWWQAVTLSALNDEDSLDGQALFQVAISGVATQWVTATELDDDIGENLALASRGATITGGRNPNRLIDGLHMSSANYGHTVWAGDPPEAMTLKLKVPAMVTRVRLLNWDWLYPVTHRYTIESSVDGKNWTLLVDATAEDRKGWDDWAVPEQEIRYLRFTGLSNSANASVCIPEWEVYGERMVVPATVVLQNLVQKYDGTPRQVAVETDPPELPVEVMYSEAPSGAGGRSSSPTVIDADSEPPVEAGTYIVVAQVADDDYAGLAQDTLIVEKADQSIEFPNPGTQAGECSLRLVAEASSGLPVQFAVASGPAHLDETGVRLVFSGTGTVCVVASQPGDGNWNPAADVSACFDVTCSGLVPVFSQPRVNVREGGEGRFFVRLNVAPESTVALNVTRGAGDEGLSVVEGTSLAFTPANWNAWQMVTLAAAEDDNAENETALFRVVGEGVTERAIEATALDSDIGENFALASAGATISGSRASRAAQLIDGAHDDRANYGFTVWTNAQPGTFTVDMQSPVAVSRVRLLNWDWLYRIQRYTIESSMDGTTWTLLADASQDGLHGWNDWAVDGREARYLRFTGLHNSHNQCVLISELEVYGTRPLPELIQVSKPQVNVREGGEGRFFVRLNRNPVEPVVATVSRVSGDESIALASGETLAFTSANWALWQAVTLVAPMDGNADGETATFMVSIPGQSVDQFVEAATLDGDIGENLALASGGATIAWSRASRAAQLIDGTHASSANYGYTIWTNDIPGTMTLDLKVVATVSRVRLLNWDWMHRVQRYTIEASADGQTWTMLADASGEDRQGWDDWAVADQPIRFLRFTGLYNSQNQCVLVSELEVYGTRQPPPAKASTTVSAKAIASRTPIVRLDSIPMTVLTSDGPEDETGWNALDGDINTAWVGQKAGGGYLVVGYEPALVLSAIEVDLAEGSLADVEFLYSLDAEEWMPLPDDLETNPIELNYLWLVFPDDGTDALPVVHEIRTNP